ncbi:MAG: galactokinase [bacterium]
MEYAVKIKKKFEELFGTEPFLVCSPGRVNLIGEHTDYNMGFVLPAAIDKAIYFAIAPNGGTECTLYSVDMDDTFKFSTCCLEFSEKHWVNYLMGVVDQLKKRGHEINGFNCVFGGDIPIGAGLSSSAAIEAGLAFALNDIFRLGIEKMELVRLAQKAENEFVGVQCGIMDQYINIFGKAGNVLRIDCRSLDYDYFPFDFDDISIVLFNTMVSHSLASSEYNQRRKECAAGVEVIQKKYPNVKSLRDVSIEMIREYAEILNPVIYKRCKYVVEENDRLIRACDSLNKGDLKTFGNLMNETHEGLSKDYEVSCEELDYLVELTKEIPEVYGSRMMGGGFGGCTINLIENGAVEKVSNYVSEKYKMKFNNEPKIYITKIHDGTQIIRDI